MSQVLHVVTIFVGFFQLMQYQLCYLLQKLLILMKNISISFCMLMSVLVL